MSYDKQLTLDGSYTLFSHHYGQSYHATREGALFETLHKHVKPAFDHHSNKASLHVLDICFGLGFNTLTTLWYNDTVAHKKLYIYSPELDLILLGMLHDFEYPEVLRPYKHVIEALVSQGIYENMHMRVELYVGDARDYIKRFNNHFDVIYQDAFSPQSNSALWTVEYFHDLKNALTKDAILTSYSTALATRLALLENGFFIYTHEGEGFRMSTLATLQATTHYKAVDMAHKIACNPNVHPLRD